MVDDALSKCIMVRGVNTSHLLFLLAWPAVAQEEPSS